jgi:hypothetical protein
VKNLALEWQPTLCNTFQAMMFWRPSSIVLSRSRVGFFLGDAILCQFSTNLLTFLASQGFISRLGLRCQCVGRGECSVRLAWLRLSSIVLGRQGWKKHENQTICCFSVAATRSHTLMPSMAVRNKCPQLCLLLDCGARWGTQFLDSEKHSP